MSEEATQPLQSLKWVQGIECLVAGELDVVAGKLLFDSDGRLVVAKGDKDNEDDGKGRQT